MKFAQKAKVSDESLTSAFADEFRQVTAGGLGPWKIIVRPNDYSHIVTTYTARSAETVFKIMREYMARDIEFEIQIIPQRLWRARRTEGLPEELEEPEVIEAQEVSVEPVEEGSTLQ